MFKTIFFTVFITVAAFISLKGQSNYHLIGEKNENSISLIWSVDKWDATLNGVYIKRRQKDKSGKISKWEYLTHEMLLQYNTLNKPLDNVTNSKKKAKALEEKRSVLITNITGGKTRLSEISLSDFKNEMLNKDVLNMMGLMFVFDYDIALLYGFGYVDYKTSDNSTVEYGLFTVNNSKEEDKPVATFRWDVDQEIDLNIKPKSHKIKRRGDKVIMSLYYDGNQLDSKQTLAGFNIYRSTDEAEEVLLNNKVIWLSKGSNKRELYYEDKIEDAKVGYTYNIKPVSIFKNEGESYQLEWNPEHDLVIAAPRLESTQEPNTDVIVEGLDLKWQLDTIFNNKITGFIIQRRIDGQGSFVSISDTLNPISRTYTDQTLSDKSISNIHYRVIMVPIDSHPLWSNTLRWFYNPKPVIKSLIELSVTPRLEGENAIVNLSWDAEDDFVNDIKRFVIYCDRAGGILARENTSLTDENSFDYYIEGSRGKRYQFNIKYENLDGTINNYSDTVVVIIPSASIPQPVVWPYNVQGGNLSFEWKYPDDIDDLKGFKVLLNNEQIFNEDEVASAARNYTVENLDPGKYILEIQAVTIYNTLSKRSGKINFTIESR